MWLWLTSLSIASIGYGAWLKVKRIDEWDSEESMAIYRDQIDYHREEFLNQFKLSQESIESLYGEDLTDLKNQMSLMTNQMAQIQSFLKDAEWERRLEGSTISPQKKAQLKKVWELEQLGYSDENIARTLGVGIGEVLLLKQMHN